MTLDLTVPGPDALTALLEHDQVVDAVVRYTRGLDLDDADLLTSSLTEDATVDLSPGISRMGGTFPPLAPRSVVLEQLLPVVGPMDTSHSITNPRVTFDGDTAVLTCYAQAQHFAPGDGPRFDRTRHGLMMNRYTARLVRDQGAPTWRIRHLSIDNAWFEGDLTLLLP